jgi:hypothetical protein
MIQPGVHENLGSPSGEPSGEASIRRGRHNVDETCEIETTELNESLRNRLIKWAF